MRVNYISRMTIDIRFDFQRRDRIGLTEAIWGADKSVDQLKRISKEVLSKKEIVLITRINKEKAIHLLKIYRMQNITKRLIA